MLARTYLPAVIIVITWWAAPNSLHAQRVPVDRRVLGADTVKVLGRAGVRTLPANENIVQLRPGEYLVARLGDSATLKATAATIQWGLPIRLVGADEAGQRVTLKPVVEVAAGGLRIRPGTPLFTGEIQLGIEDEERPTESHSLGRSIRMLISAEADSTVPNRVAINHTNLPFTSVRIVALQPGDSVRVRIRSDFDPEGIDILVPVVRPQLSLRVTPQSIQGLGLETAALTVRALGMSQPESVVVSLTSDRGRLEPTLVALSSSGTGSALIRSSGIGTARIDGEADPMLPDTVSVEFVFPWAFGIAALLGGLIGGVIRYLTLKFQRVSKISWTGLTAHVALGTLAGFVIAVSYAVGINLLNVYPSATTGEALVFVIAALGAVGSGGIVSRMVPPPPKPTAP